MLGSGFLASSVKDARLRGDLFTELIMRLPAIVARLSRCSLLMASAVKGGHEGTATGTVDDVPVRVGSPSAIGTVTLLVHVLYPGSPVQAASSH